MKSSEALQTHDSLKSEGKLREIGLSNESCWGTMQYLQIAKEHNLPHVISMQNEYSLMHRIYDLDMAEMSHHENVGLLSYSPLACGMLTGKYLSGNIPRWFKTPALTPTSGVALAIYPTPRHRLTADVARQHDLEPTQMAVAFCLPKAIHGIDHYRSYQRRTARREPWVTAI